MPRMRQVLMVALVAAVVVAALDSAAGIGQSTGGAVIQKRVEQGGLAPGKAGYITLNCPRGYVATPGGFATSLPALVTAATVVDRRHYAVVVYNTLQTVDIVVAARAICIQGTVVRTVVSRAATASGSSLSATGSLDSLLQAARDAGYKVVRIGA